jgi:hypothetical protein
MMERCGSTSATLTPAAARGRRRRAYGGKIEQTGASSRERKGAALFAVEGCKAKDLMGIPWMLAFALRADGWYLRQDIIWSKPNPMPESVRDRCTKAHEYLFLLSKGPRYYFDQDAIAEPSAFASRACTVGAEWVAQSGEASAFPAKRTADEGSRAQV